MPVADTRHPLPALQGPRLPQARCGRCRLSYTPGYYCHPLATLGFCYGCWGQGLLPLPGLILAS